jgi:hypothetical protein
MTSNAFDMVRKIRHLPGLKLTATIEPQHITKRIKNAAQKMLRTGIVTGGYTAKSRMLAEQLLDDANREVPVYVAKWGVSIQDMALLTKEVREPIMELIDAARMVEHANGTEQSAPYINERYDLMRKQVKNTKIGRLSFSLYNPAIQQQVAELVASCRTPLMVEIHNELANKLDSTEPIEVNFYA